MKFARLAVFAIALPMSALPIMAFAKSIDKTDVESALVDWKNAVESAKVDNIMKLYDRNAVMISTFMQNPMTNRSQISGYFKRVVTNPDIHVEIEETHPRTFGDVAVNSGRYTLSYTQDGEPVSLPARFSFTYVQKDGKWLIVDQHSSRVPLPEEAQ